MTADKPKVYYNSKCPVCDAGIKSQRGKMEQAACEIAWQDINDTPDALLAKGHDLEAVRKKLVVEAPDGTLHVGADAFAILWRATPGQRWLGWLIAQPGLRQIARGCYNGFAWLLYRWNRRHGRW